MPSRKRVYEEVDSDESIPESFEDLSTLRRIRGMWEFAAFNQYLFFFGKAVKVDDVDVEVRTGVFSSMGRMEDVQVEWHADMSCFL